MSRTWGHLDTWPREQRVVWVSTLGVRTICPALVRTVRRPSFTGRIALFWHRLRRIRFSATEGLGGDTQEPLRVVFGGRYRPDVDEQD